MTTSTSPAELSPLPLAGWHEDQGANWRSHRGYRAPASYGDPTGEYWALRDSVALVDRSDAARLELLGADRSRFLNGLCTTNVATLEERHSVYGFVTEAKGRVLADLEVVAFDDRMWLLLPPQQRDAIQNHLARYLVADQVEILPLEDLLPLTLVGAGVADAFTALGVALPEELDRHQMAELSESQVCLQRHLWQGVEAFTVWVSASIADLLADDLIEQLGARPAGVEACEMLRLEENWPLFGIDYGNDNLPQETSLPDAVDFEKGCYLGQEVIARLHYRGRAAKGVHSITIGGEEPDPGAALLFEGRACGKITSVAHSPRESTTLGLAMVQRRAAEPGVELAIEGGGKAVIREG